MNMPEIIGLFIKASLLLFFIIIVVLIFTFAEKLKLINDLSDVLLDERNSHIYPDRIFIPQDSIFTK